MKTQIKRWSKYIFCTVLGLLGILLLTAAILYCTGTYQLKKRPSEVPNLADGETWYWQDENTLIADGMAYHPKKNLSTVLCIGLGSSQEREENGFTMGMMPMADTFVLAVEDRSTGAIDLIAIPRDTQAELDWVVQEAQPPHGEKAHLALQYRYGGADHSTCSKTTVDTVSRLLYDIGISGYVTIDMDSIVYFADLIGGVPITVPDDPYYCAYTGYTPGQWIRMDGPTALQFVQYRDLYVPGSCEMRVERQKIFLDALVSWVVKKLKTAPWEIPYCVQKMKPYYFTDLHINEIAALGLNVLKLNYRDFSMHTLPGTVVKGQVYEEYHLDEQGVRRMLLDIFYQPA